jgi:nucleoside-diphosphate-sugar epimerase
MSDQHPPPSMRLLVTGASGFIGSRLALFAHRLGMDVRATGRAELDIEHERLNELRAAGVAVEPGLLQDAALVRTLLQDRDVLIHLAAAQHESAMPESYFQAANVDVVSRLLDESHRAGIQRFVYGSTIGVYGEATDELLDEDSPVRPGNMYTRTKHQAESLVRARSEEFGTCVVRIGETYGPGDLRLLKLFRALDRGRFVMIGSGTNRRQCIHVEDLIRGLLVTAQHPAAAGETFILAGPQIMTTNEMVAQIAAALGRTAPRTRVPLWPLLAAAGVMETLLRPLRIQPPLHLRRLDFFRKSFVFSTAKAEARLGFAPQIDFRAGVLDTAQWYRARGALSPAPAKPVARVESA